MQVGVYKITDFKPFILNEIVALVKNSEKVFFLKLYDHTLKFEIYSNDYKITIDHFDSITKLLRFPAKFLDPGTIYIW